MERRPIARTQSVTRAFGGKCDIIGFGASFEDLLHLLTVPLMPWIAGRWRRCAAQRGSIGKGRSTERYHHRNE